MWEKPYQALDLVGIALGAVFGVLLRPRTLRNEVRRRD